MRSPPFSMHFIAHIKKAHQLEAKIFSICAFGKNSAAAADPPAYPFSVYPPAPAPVFAMMYIYTVTIEKDWSPIPLTIPRIGRSSFLILRKGKSHRLADTAAAADPQLGHDADADPPALRQKIRTMALCERRCASGVLPSGRGRYSIGGSACQDGGFRDERWASGTAQGAAVQYHQISRPKPPPPTCPFNPYVCRGLKCLQSVTLSAFHCC